MIIFIDYLNDIYIYFVFYEKKDKFITKPMLCQYQTIFMPFYV